MDYTSDLIAMGFTEYEARVYLVLLGENPATGYQLSKKAGIPRSMVYEALGRLAARGAVLKTSDQRTTLYRPVPPDMLLDRYEQEQTRLVKSLRASLKLLYASQDEDHLWSINGRSPVLAYAVQMLQEAVSEIWIVLPDSALEALRPDINAAANKGIELNALLTGQGELEFVEHTHHPPLESELQQLTSLLLIVIDGKKCLIADTAMEMSATITTNRNLVLIARQFVWMEFFAQRLAARLGPDLVNRLEIEDRRILGINT